MSCWVHIRCFLFIPSQLYTGEGVEGTGRALGSSPLPHLHPLCEAQSTDTFFPSFFQSWCSCPAQARSLGSKIFCRNWGLEDHGAHRVEGGNPELRPLSCSVSRVVPVSPVLGGPGLQLLPTARKCSWTNICSSCRGMLRLWVWASSRKCLRTWSGGQAAGGVSGTPGSLP